MDFAKVLGTTAYDEALVLNVLFIAVNEEEAVLRGVSLTKRPMLSEVVTSQSCTKEGHTVERGSASGELKKVK